MALEDGLEKKGVLPKELRDRAVQHLRDSTTLGKNRPEPEKIIDRFAQMVSDNMSQPYNDDTSHPEQENRRVEYAVRMFREQIGLPYALSLELVTAIQKNRSVVPFRRPKR